MPDADEHLAATALSYLALCSYLHYTVAIHDIGQPNKHVSYSW